MFLYSMNNWLNNDIVFSTILLILVKYSSLKQCCNGVKRKLSKQFSTDSILSPAVNMPYMIIIVWIFEATENPVLSLPLTCTYGWNSWKMSWNQIFWSQVVENKENSQNLAKLLATENHQHAITSIQNQNCRRSI